MVSHANLGGRPIDDDLYAGVLIRTAAYDGKAYLAIRSTGIVCFPSCRSRIPKRANIFVYDSWQQAVEDGFRPCKRCKPDLGPRTPDAELVARVMGILESRCQEPLSLASLGEALHVSPSHLQRVFSRHTGMSPQKALENLRVERAGRWLREGRTVSWVANAVGYRSRSHFVRVFYRHTGHTPSMGHKTGEMLHE